MNIVPFVLNWPTQEIAPQFISKAGKYSFVALARPIEEL
jgi:hypothetical protein